MDPTSPLVAVGHPYDALPDATLIVDTHGRVDYANPAAARLLGRPVGELTGALLGEGLRLADGDGRDWWSCTAGLRALPGVTRITEVEVRAGEGSPLHLTAGFTRSNGSVTQAVVCLRDAGARERAERDHAELVSTVAHELRSPLTSVKGFTATLLAKWERFSDEQKKVMLATVNADADRVTRLLSELLDVSRIDAGRLELRLQVVDLAAAVRRCVAGRIAAGDSPGRFTLDLWPAGVDLWLDADKVDQILGNLVENALRHGAGEVRIAIRPAGEFAGGGVVLTVADQGEGVPPELRNRIFTRFFRGRARRGGTGLGLYIVKGLVEAHGGRVGIEDAPGGGALFTVALPAGRAPYDAAD